MRRSRSTREAERPLKRDFPHGVCHWCAEPILAGDRISPIALDGVAMHLECGLRMVMGGANHLLKQCTCCGGKLPPDPEGMTVREAARWAVKVLGWVRELGEVVAREQAQKNPR